MPQDQIPGNPEEEYQIVGNIYERGNVASASPPVQGDGYAVVRQGTGPVEGRNTTSFPRAMNIGAGDMNQGAFNTLSVLGYPTDLMNWLMKQTGLPVSERPIMGSEWISGLPQRLGIASTVPGEERYPIEKLLGAATRTVGETMPLSLGITARAATTLPKLADKSAPVLKQIAQGTLNQARAHPVENMARDAFTSAWAGIGGEVAKENFPDSPVAQTIGELGGAVGSQFMPTRLAVEQGLKGVSRLQERFPTEGNVKDWVKNFARRKAAENVQEAITSNPEAVQRARAIRERIPGLQTTATEETQSPILKASQEFAEARMGSEELSRAARRRQGNIERVEEFARSAAPESPAPPEIIVDVAKGRVDRLTARVAKEVEGVEGRRQRIPEAMRHGDRQDLGGRVRMALTEAMEERSKQFEKLADQWGINDAAIQAKGPLAKEGKKIMGLYSALMDKRFGPEASGLARALGIDRVNPKAPATFKAIKKIRENISKDIIEATAGGNVDRGEVRLLIALRTKIDSFVERLTEQAGTPELAANLKKFRAAYFQNYIKPFDEGVAVKIRQRDAHGFYRTPDENVGQTVWKSETSGRGALANIDKWREIFGPKRDDLLKDVIADDLYRSVVDNDVVNVRRLKAWQAKHQDALRKLGWDPSTSVEAAETTISKRLDTLRQRRDRIQDSVLSSVTKGNKSATELLEGSIQNPKEWTSLVGTIRRSPEALPAARRLMFERAGAIQDPDKLLAFIDQNRKALAQIMTPRHLNDLETLANARKMVTFVDDPAGRPISTNPLESIERIIGNKIPVIATRIYQGTTGRASRFWIVTDRVRAFLESHGERIFSEAIKEAISNPESARKMLDGMGQPMKAGAYREWFQSGRRVPSWLMAIGIAPNQPDVKMEFRMEKPQQ